MVTFSAKIVDGIAPGVSAFTEASIPDLQERYAGSRYWLTNHFLNSVLSGRYKGRPKHVLVGVLRRAYHAFYRYHRATDRTLNYLASSKPDNPNVSGYFAAVEKWEIFILHSMIAIDLFNDLAPTFSGSDVARILGSAGATRGLPERIRVDHGTEFTSKALDHWAYWNRVELDFIRPGKPTDNPFIEAFNATLRRECLSQHWFVGLEDAQMTLDRWKEDYNNHRPHSSLDNQPPAHFRAGGAFIPDRNRLQKLRC